MSDGATAEPGAQTNDGGDDQFRMRLSIDDLAVAAAEQSPVKENKRTRKRTASMRAAATVAAGAAQSEEARPARRRKTSCGGGGAAKRTSSAGNAADTRSDSASGHSGAANVAPYVGMPPVTATSPAELTREQLLGMSSADCDRYARELGALRTLTDQEKMILRQQRRLVKNRESAQASRRRKKTQVCGLQAKYDYAVARNHELVAQRERLSADNAELRARIDELRRQYGTVASGASGVAYEAAPTAQAYEHASAAAADAYIGDDRSDDGDDVPVLV